MLAIYLVLGIGADDIFVFVDGWRQSVNEYDNPTDRLDATYKRAAKAMGATSATTCVAFIATAVSPIMPIASFGIYAAMGIFFNYVLVMTLFPCTLMIWHYKFYGCCPAIKVKGAAKTTCCCHRVDGCLVPPAPPVKGEKPSWRPCCEPAKLDPASTAVAPEAATAIDRSTEPTAKGGASNDEEVLGKIETFMRDKYAPFISKPAVSGTMVGLGLVYIIFCCVAASKLQPPTEQEKWFPEDHMYQQIVDAMSTFAADADDSYIEMRLAFGLKGMDRDGINFWEPCCLENGNRGKVIYDTDFSLASKENQDFLNDTCTALMTTSCTLSGCAGGRLVKPEDESSTWCWIRQFANWCATNGNLATGTDSCVDANFLPNILKFRTEHSPKYDDAIGVIDDELKYAMLTVRSTLLQFQPNRITEPIFDEFTKFTTSHSAGAPPGMQTMIHSGGVFWTWTFTEAALVTNVFVGFAICFPCAFVVLLLATRNIVVSVIAMVSVMGIVASVMGFCHWAMGWGLGIAESIASVIVIGFSVDYVVHLAHMYVDAGHKSPPLQTRSQRSAYALKTMGATVLAGSATTFGSGFFLVLTQLIFFVKFSVLIMVTIASSIAIAMLFFMPALALLGPEGDCGDLVVVFSGKKAGQAEDGQYRGKVSASAVVPEP